MDNSDFKIKKTPGGQYLSGVFILIIANICFSAKAVIIKLMYQYHVDTMSVIALRMFFSVPVFIGTAIYLSRKKGNIPLTLREAAMIGGLGILSYYISSMLDFLGLQYISASVERLILFTYPTIVLVLSAVFFKKKINTPQLWALFLTYVGVVIAFVAERGLGQQSDVVKGVLLVFSCAFTYALYVVGTGELVHRFGTIKFTSYAMMAATVPALVQSYFYNGMDIFHFQPQVYHLTFWLAIVSTVIPVFLIIEGIRIVGANNSSIIGFSGPIATIFLGAIFLGEKVTILQLLGTAIVLIGISLITLKSKK
jgi:drug/metabolite transporter (DMT)-like permease